MKNYKIYTDSQGKIETVKMGWSWSAFVFTWVWTLKNKVWRVTTLTTGVLILSTIFSFIVAAITPEFVAKISLDLFFIYSGYLALSFSFLMGMKGNQWHEKTLLRNGAVFQSVIIANTPDEALVFYTQGNVGKYLMIA